MGNQLQTAREKDGKGCASADGMKDTESPIRPVHDTSEVDEERGASYGRDSILP